MLPPHRATIYTPPARTTLVQLSDTHIVPEGELLYGSVDTYARLAAAIAAIEASDAAPAALLLTGDLADSGSAEEYKRLRDLVEPAAERMGAEVVYAMGNHDDPVAFRAALLGPEESGLVEADTHEPYDHARLVGGLRVVVLDSTITGRGDGYLTDDQLAWLRDVLTDPAPDGTVLVLHHPPIVSPVVAVELIGLHSADGLADAVRGSDVRIIVSGHAHHTSAGVLAGVPVWIAPATAYRADVLPPSGMQRSEEGAGFTRIDIYPSGAVATFVPVDKGATLEQATEDDLWAYVRYKQAEHAAAQVT